MTTMRNKAGVVRKSVLLTLLANVPDDAYVAVYSDTDLSYGHLSGLDYSVDRVINLTSEVITQPKGRRSDG